MTMNPSKSLVVVGGSFTQIAGTAAFGLAALDPTSGSRIYWAATDVVQAYGQDNNGPGTGAAIYSLSTDGTSVFGTAYNFRGLGNLEGTFKADGETGAVNWVEDCHGDTYAAFGTATAVYTVSHDHFCGNMGGYPQTNTWSVNMRHALAFTQSATGTINHDQLGYHDWFGTATPSLINWFPELSTGTYTGQSQAAWTISGNSQYVVTGGEFPAVNGTPQQGLARFAIPSLAPKKQGPRLNSTNWLLAARPLTANTVHLAITANWDRDDENLTYYVVRNNKAIATINATSQFWNRPMITYMDTGVTPGTTYNYFVKAVDPDGNAQYSNTVSVAVPASGTVSPYSYAVYNDGAAYYWRLNEGSGNTSSDSSHFEDLTLNGTVTHNQAGAISDGDTADKFSGSSSFGATGVERSAPNVFTEEGWFKTTTSNGGKIVGFGNKKTGTSSTTDRHTYMNTSGTVSFGVNNTASRITITTTKRYNDGQWHYFAGSMSPSGMAFYLDGQLVGTNAATTNGQSYTGYWRVGGDAAWSGANYFNGSIDDVAIYPTALSAAQVAQHYAAASATNKVPTAAFTASTSNLTANLDATTSSDPDGTITAYNWAFGDGTTGTGATASHAYAAAGTYSVTLTVTDNLGATATSTQSVTVVAPNVSPTAAFTSSVNLLDVTFDSSGSNDPDGTIASYAWDFGDGTTSTEASPVHSYTAAGTYTVTLTVTDNGGGTGTVSHQVTAVAPNVLPTAAFTSSVNGLMVMFDASGSNDPDGSIASYAWDFGDGTTGTGVSPTHTYATVGTFTVTLLVTDNRGGTNSVSHDVVTVAGPFTVASDDFERTASNGWGSAAIGGAWTRTSGAASAYSVDGHLGNMTVTTPGSAVAQYLNSVSGTNMSGSVDVGYSAAPTGGGSYTYIAVRHTASGEYRIRVRLAPTSTTLQVTSLVSGTETVLAQTTVTGLVYNLGDVLRMKLNVSGSGTTALQAKVWKVGTSEPAAWQIDTTNSNAALQGPGTFGLLGYLSGGAGTVAPLTFQFDNLSVTQS
jgi:PKD repeat protein